MLLFITGSADGTADRLVERYGEGIFRLNHDLLEHYHVAFSETGWEIISPSGLRIDSESVTGAYWWKAFSYWATDADNFVAAETRYLCRDLYGWCAYRGLTIGNPSDYHNRLGKLTILGVALEFFSVPSTLVTVNMHGTEHLAGQAVIAKSLSSEVNDSGKILHTTQVSLESLHPKFPWYLQYKVESLWDVTVFFCDGQCFSFKRDRSDLKGLDWRSEQSFDFSKEEWTRFDLGANAEAKIKALSVKLGVDFGRYDFMTDADDQLVFLELNANGQWVFLDIRDQYRLLDCVVSWLRRSCARSQTNSLALQS